MRLLPAECPAPRLEMRTLGRLPEWLGGKQRSESACSNGDEINQKESGNRKLFCWTANKFIDQVVEIASFFAKLALKRKGTS
jgi:hypothetical protein